MAYIDQFFHFLVEQGASDLHIGENEPPKMRLHGTVIPIRETPLSHDEIVGMMSEICGPSRWEKFMESGDLDFA